MYSTYSILHIVCKYIYIYIVHVEKILYIYIKCIQSIIQYSIVYSIMYSISVYIYTYTYSSSTEYILFQVYIVQYCNSSITCQYMNCTECIYIFICIHTNHGWIYVNINIYSYYSIVFGYIAITLLSTLLFLSITLATDIL